jgi:hypothetical protein
VHGKADKGAPAAVDGLTTVATQLLEDASTATGVDANRLRALAAALKGRAEIIH